MRLAMKRCRSGLMVAADDTLRPSVPFPLANRDQPAVGDQHRVPPTVRSATLHRREVLRYSQEFAIAQSNQRVLPHEHFDTRGLALLECIKYQAVLQVGGS